MARAGRGPRFLDPLSKAGKPLSEREAKDLVNDLVDALGTLCDQADDAISATNRRGEEAAIWSTLDDDDLNTLAKVWLKLGRRSAVVAQSVRGFMETYEYWIAGTLVTGRFVQTGMFYLENGIGLPPRRRA